MENILGGEYETCEHREPTLKDPAWFAKVALNVLISVL